MRSADNQATQMNGELRKLDSVMGADLAAFNKLIRDENVPPVEAPRKKAVR